MPPFSPPLLFVIAARAFSMLRPDHRRNHAWYAAMPTMQIRLTQTNFPAVFFRPPCKTAKNAHDA